MNQKIWKHRKLVGMGILGVFGGNFFGVVFKGTASEMPINPMILGTPGSYIKDIITTEMIKATHKQARQSGIIRELSTSRVGLNSTMQRTPGSNIKDIITSTAMIKATHKQARQSGIIRVLSIFRVGLKTARE